MLGNSSALKMHHQGTARVNAPGVQGTPGVVRGKSPGEGLQEQKPSEVLTIFHIPVTLSRRFYLMSYYMKCDVNGPAQVITMRLVNFEKPSHGAKINNNALFKAWLSCYSCVLGNVINLQLKSVDMTHYFADWPFRVSLTNCIGRALDQCTVKGDLRTQRLWGTLRQAR